MEGDYNQDFDTVKYIKWRYNCDLSHEVMLNNGDRDRVLFPMQCYHELFATSEFVDSKGLSLLDFGAGPVVISLISAAPHVSSITLSDYGESNRKYLQEWVSDSAGDTKLKFDWTPYFDYIVRNLERKEVNAVEKRIESVRKAVKAVVACDLTKESIIESGHEGPYDIVHTSLTVCVTSKSLDEYKNQIKKISKLVKPGGKFLLFEAERELGLELQYQHADHNWSYIGLSREFVAGALGEAGFVDIYMKTAGTTNKFSERNYMFFAATKMK